MKWGCPILSLGFWAVTWQPQTQSQRLSVMFQLNGLPLHPWLRKLLSLPEAAIANERKIELCWDVLEVVQSLRCIILIDNFPLWLPGNSLSFSLTLGIWYCPIDQTCTAWHFSWCIGLGPLPLLSLLRCSRSAKRKSINNSQWWKATNNRSSYARPVTKCFSATANSMPTTQTQQTYCYWVLQLMHVSIDSIWSWLCSFG